MRDVAKAASMERDLYQKKAAECLLAAEQLRDPGERLRLLEIAQQYISLAAHVTTRLNQGTPHRSVNRQTGDRFRNDT
jgi:hypothetical protein